jgi:hypothetical protein
MVSTTIAAPISAAGLATVTPGSMANIVPQGVLYIDAGAAQELVVVTATSTATFTAYFALSHAAHVVVQDQGAQAFQFSQPNAAIDLTTIDLVHSYSGVRSGGDDSMIQLCITSASLEWIWRTGRGPEGYVPAASPFVTPQPYDEFYDGNGGSRMFLRNWPIRSVQGLYINGRAATPSLGGGQLGYVIDQSKKSLAIVGYSSQSTPYVGTRGSFFYRSPNLGRTSAFPEGVQNIEAQYTAGFDQVPPDIVRACSHMVAINYKRKGWLDQASKTMGAQGVTGTDSFRAWELPPEVMHVIRQYSRDYAV